MRPCADPRICGVKNHKSGTVCRAEQSRWRRGTVSDAPALAGPPPSASKGDSRPVPIQRTPDEQAHQTSLEKAIEAYEEFDRPLLEQDPLADNLDLDDHVSFGTAPHLVRVKEHFSTKNMSAQEGDYVPVHAFVRLGQRPVMTPSEWDRDGNLSKHYGEAINEHLPRVINRDRERTEIADRLTASYEQGKQDSVEMEVEGRRVRFTIKGEGAFESPDDGAHASFPQDEGGDLHSWIDFDKKGRTISTYVGDEEGNRVDPNISRNYMSTVRESVKISGEVKAMLDRGQVGRAMSALAREAIDRDN